MSWIKIQTNLIEIPEVGSIAARLRMAEAHVVGCLVSVWSWADSLTADGFVQYATGAQIDKKAGKKGFAEAMTCVGWLRLEASGVTFPKWDRHNGESAKARAGEAEAKRLIRAGNRRSGPAPVSAQNEPNTSGQMSGQNGDKCPDQRRGEEIREENTNTINPPHSGVTESFPGISTDSTPPNESRLNDAEAIYSAYPRKVGRGDALKAIVKALRSIEKRGPLDGHESASAYLLQRANAYAQSVATWPEHDRQFIPHPATWFNGERYADDPATWARSTPVKNQARTLSTDLSHEQLTKIHKGSF